MTDKDTGGPAFPGSDWVNVPDCENPNAPPYKQVEYGPGSGMSLREWFAGHALSSITANDFALHNYIPSHIAEWAYQMADAMLAERDK